MPVLVLDWLSLAITRRSKCQNVEADPVHRRSFTESLVFALRFAKNDAAEPIHNRGCETDMPIALINGRRWRKNFGVVQRTRMRNFRSFRGSMLTERNFVYQI
jgi:hypothetical protein